MRTRERRPAADQATGTPPTEKITAAAKPQDHPNPTAAVARRRPLLTGRSRPACGRRRLPFVEITCPWCGGQHLHRLGETEPGDVVRTAGCCDREYVIRVLSSVPRRVPALQRVAC